MMLTKLEKKWLEAKLPIVAERGRWEGRGYQVSAMSIWPLLWFLVCSAALDSRVLQKPLIGAPRWLALHQAIEFTDGEDGERFCMDFIPMDATSPETLKRLITLGSVAGEVRLFAADAGNVEASILAKARRLQSEYPKELHLVKNNCMTFVKFANAYFI